jgi:hypothetical protein
MPPLMDTESMDIQLRFMDGFGLDMSKSIWTEDQGPIVKPVVGEEKNGGLGAVPPYIMVLHVKYGFE